MQRYEIKFDITQENINKIIKDMNLTKIYPNRIVNSTYFDTNNFKFFSLSEEGVTPRIKVRTRCYNDKNLMNLEIKKTNNYHREKIVIKDIKVDHHNLHDNLKKVGINRIVYQKLRVKYLRSYYLLDGIGRITMDKDIEFLSPNVNFHNSKKIQYIILEVKTQSNNIDKNFIEKIINFKETRFSKYCTGMNYLLKSI